MAQTVKSYAQPSVKISIGGRLLTVTEIEFGTEYLTEGFVVSAESLGLTDGLIDAAWCAGVSGPAKAATGAYASCVVTEGSKLKIQLYGTGSASGKPLKEEASKGEEYKETKVTIIAIGR